MACGNCNPSGPGTQIVAGDGIAVSGSGTVSNPYRVSSDLLQSPLFEVRDSNTVNLTLFGAGSQTDPYVLSADTSAASALQSLADVQSPAPVAGTVPQWIGTSVAGHFEFLPNGVVYCTSSTRPDSAHRFQGLQIKEQDTGNRYEWDGTTWQDITPATLTSFPASSLTGTLNDTTLPSRLQQYGSLLVGTDLNTVRLSGWYRGSTLPNQPVSDNGANFYFYEVQAHSSAADGNVVQIAHQYASERCYKRVFTGTAWGAWTEIVTTIRSGVLDGHNDARYVQNESTGSPSRIESGLAVFTGKFTAATTGYNATVHVTFSKAFSVKPQVTFTPHTGYYVNQHVGVLNVTTTGCDLYWYREVNPGTGALDGDWIAVGAA